MIKTTIFLTAIAALFTVLGLQSCSKDALIAEVPPTPEEPEEQEIRFGLRGTDVAEPVSRGTTITLDDIPNVGLYGYYTANERWTWSADNQPAALKPNYFCNETLQKSGATGAYSWHYEGVPRFWPPDTGNKVSFFAYSPYVETVDGEGNLIDLTGQAVVPYPAIASETGFPTLRYTLPANIANHMDVLRASNIDMTKYGADGMAATADDGLVPMIMEHALTQITFSAQYANAEDDENYTVLINSVALTGIYTQGTLRLGNGQWLFDADAVKASISIQGRDLAGEAIDDGNKLYPLLNPDLGTLMLMPQPLAASSLVLNATFRDPDPLKDDVTASIAFALEETGLKWEPGKSIDYRVLIKGGFISVQTTIRPWIAYGSDLSGGVGL